jgi:hypothetical protein
MPHQILFSLGHFHFNIVLDISEKLLKAGQRVFSFTSRVIGLADGCCSSSVITISGLLKELPSLLSPPPPLPHVPAQSSHWAGEVSLREPSASFLICCVAVGH